MIEQIGSEATLSPQYFGCSVENPLNVPLTCDGTLSLVVNGQPLRFQASLQRGTNYALLRLRQATEDDRDRFTLEPGTRAPITIPDSNRNMAGGQVRLSVFAARDTPTEGQNDIIQPVLRQGDFPAIRLKILVISGY